MTSYYHANRRNAGRETQFLKQAGSFIIIESWDVLSDGDGVQRKCESGQGVEQPLRGTFKVDQ